MKKILLLSFLFAATMLSAQKPVELPLWPNGAPNNNELTNSGQNHNNEWVSDVTTPTLTVYPASHPNGMAIIMCPGGGYGGLAMKHEGHDMAPWFNTQGITYAVTHDLPQFGRFQMIYPACAGINLRENIAN